MSQCPTGGWRKRQGTEIYAWPELIYNMCVSDIKDNIPCVQVKNKPHVGEWKHAFILGSMVYMVVNTKSSRLQFDIETSGLNCSVFVSF